MPSVYIILNGIEDPKITHSIQTFCLFAEIIVERLKTLRLFNIVSKKLDHLYKNIQAPKQTFFENSFKMLNKDTIFFKISFKTTKKLTNVALNVICEATKSEINQQIS